MVLDFDAGSDKQVRSINESQKATVLNKPLELQIRTWHPVPVGEDVVSGVALGCTEKEYIETIINSWNKYREQYQTVDSQPVFKKTPETEQMLEELAKHSDTELAELAKEALKVKSKESEFILPRRKWWQIW